MAFKNKEEEEKAMEKQSLFTNPAAGNVFAQILRGLNEADVLTDDTFLEGVGGIDELASILATEPKYRGDVLHEATSLNIIVGGGNSIGPEVTKALLMECPKDKMSYRVRSAVSFENWCLYLFPVDRMLAMLLKCLKKAAEDKTRPILASVFTKPALLKLLSAEHVLKALRPTDIAQFMPEEKIRALSAHVMTRSAIQGVYTKPEEMLPFLGGLEGLVEHMPIEALTRILIALAEHYTPQQEKASKSEPPSANPSTTSSDSKSGAPPSSEGETFAAGKTLSGIPVSGATGGTTNVRPVAAQIVTAGNASGTKQAVTPNGVPSTGGTIPGIPAPGGTGGAVSAAARSPGFYASVASSGSAAPADGTTPPAIEEEDIVDSPAAS